MLRKLDGIDVSFFCDVISVVSLNRFDVKIVIPDAFVMISP